MIFFADAIRLSLDVARDAAAETRRLVDEIESLAATAPNRHVVIRLLSALWGFVDWTHRTRELVQGAPGLKRNTPEIQLFLRRTKEIEKLRHHAQHLRTAISRMVADRVTPIWGVVSWVSAANPRRCTNVYIGTRVAGTHGYMCTWDSVEQRFVQGLMLSIDDVTIDVPVVNRSLDEVAPVLETWATRAGCPPRAHHQLITVWVGTVPPPQWSDAAERDRQLLPPEPDES